MSESDMGLSCMIEGFIMSPFYPRTSLRRLLNHKLEL